jgi:hypothetical protein
MLNPLGAGLDVMLCDQHPNFKILILDLCCLETHCFLFILLLPSIMFGDIYVTIFKEFSKEYKRLRHIKQYTKYNFEEVNIVHFNLIDRFANMESTLIQPFQD